MESAFWRDLAAQFVQLASEADAKRLRTDFEILARRGAGAFSPAPKGDFLVAWIEAIRQRKGDGNPQIFIPSTMALCEFSADFCNVKERDELEVERNNRSESDPQRNAAIMTHPSAIVRANQMMSDAESRAQAQLHYEKTLERLRQDESKHTKPPLVQAVDHPETIGEQIKRLRNECRWTIEKLAEIAHVHERTIARHESGDVKPYARTISAYERLFSRELKRNVVINQMP